MARNRFEKRIKITPEVLNKVALIDQFKGAWQEGLRLSPQILSRLKASVIITSSAASTRIEGAKMSDQEVARFLRGLKLKPPINRDEEENAGYADLLGRIFDNFRTLSLSEGQILQFHHILLQFSKKDVNHFGKYKTVDNVIGTKNEKGEQVILFRPSPPYLVKKEMDDVLFWTNETLKEKTIHPLLVIACFIFEFLAIHPFVDGNGRLSRALTNFLLLKAGYSYVPYVSLEEIIEDKKTEYYLSLRGSQKNHKTKNEDIGSWMIFFLDVLAIQAEKARKIMQKEQPEQVLSEKQLQVYSLFHSRDVLGVAKIAKLLKGEVPTSTIKQALARLRVLNFIERIGLGRSTRYRIKGK